MRTDVRNKQIVHYYFHCTSKKKHSKKKIKCKNHISVFITNTLIIKTTKAVQSRGAIFSFIVRLTLMR